LKSNLISKSETADVLNDVSNQWKIQIPKIKNLMLYHISEEDVIITGNGLTAIKIEEDYLPFLSNTEMLEKFPYVMVDMGAVKFMCNGANVMRPGITKYSEFKKDQIVCVIEESQHKFLAVGKSMVASDEMPSMKKGEVVKNMHFISDRFWEFGKMINPK